MGILGLSKIIADIAPFAIKDNDITSYCGRKIALDASMCLYQFLIAVRSNGAQLTTVDGETTSHLVGMFYRTIRLLENGIKPVYVFDGKPPDLKSSELAKRAERREEAQKALKEATEADNEAEMNKYNRRLVRVTKDHVSEAKQLLKLMGVPFIEAPCEAEAQCAAMVKSGKVFAVATEDMDALTFGSNVMLRNLSASEARKLPVKEYNYEKMLKAFELTHKEFIDLCILLGCDYCESIKGIGPKKAIELINKYKTIETIVENIDKSKYTIPENWNYEAVRELFINPEITNPDEIELKWSEPDEEGLVKFLCSDKQFKEDRVRNGTQKIKKCKNTQIQGRLDSFFTITSTPSLKRPQDNLPKSAAKKAKTSRGRKPK